MKRILGIFISVSFIAGAFAQQAEYAAIVNQYIRKYQDVAVIEMRIYRIPASITLAQGILESNAGRSDLATEANNHFGIKCHKGWTGKTFFKDDDAKNECFRKYENAVESFRDHSYFLTSRDRYKGLFSLDITDYKAWATGLKTAGYATNPSYAQLLIKTIETFSLDRFDKGDLASGLIDSLKKIPASDQNEALKMYMVVGKGGGNRTIYENNRLRMIISTGDDNLYAIARDVNVSVNKLLKNNDLARATALKPNQIVYLQAKRRKGAVEVHVLQQTETLYDVSQLYGVKMTSLCKRNGLQTGAKPKAGTVLRLR